MDPFDLRGRVAIVTGAGQGVGREIARCFAEHNAGGIMVNDADQVRAEAVAREVEELGSKAMPVAADVTDYDSCIEMVRQTTSRFGSIDILVNNAGNAGASQSKVEVEPFWTTEPRQWGPFVDVNLFGPMNCTRAVLPPMIERARGGRLITMISDAGRVGEPGLEAYSAAKAGAAGFTRAIARAVGRYGITANNVSIAVTRTPSSEAYLADQERLARTMSKYIVRRPGEPSDIAPVVLLLASPASEWITGQTYAVNGGFSLVP